MAAKHSAGCADRFAVLVLTARRPDLARYAILQWVLQTHTPEAIFVLQHDESPDYDWCVEDLDYASCSLSWFRDPAQMQHEVEKTAEELDLLILTDQSLPVPISQLHDLTVMPAQEALSSRVLVPSMPKAHGDASPVSDPFLGLDLSSGFYLMGPDAFLSAVSKNFGEAVQ